MAKHFIDTQDFDKSTLTDMLDLVQLLKQVDRQGACPKLLDSASLGMIFEEPSTRTRVSFEVAMTKLGGHALYLKPGEIDLGVRESLSDTANVLERMVGVIEARTLKHQTILDIAACSYVPVINGLTDYNHPTQALCDVFTMREFSGRGRKLEGLNVVFVGDATNVLNSLALICTRFGMHFTYCAPEKYQASAAVQVLAKANCELSGGSFTLADDPVAALAQADFVYTDQWWWVGQESEIPERTKAFMPRYQLNAELLEHAPPHCRVMHCLQASRGVEATDEVLDSDRSIIFDQAENRLHTESAVISTSSIFWWVFTLVLFFIPHGLITAALAPKYLEHGGIYARVKRAYGPRWEARTSWLYWVNATLLAAVCFVFIVQAIVLFVWAPGARLLTYDALAIALGTLVMLIIGEALIALAGPQQPALNMGKVS